MNTSKPKKGKYDRSKVATSYGYINNKDVRFKYITGIHINNFRSLLNRDIKLGKYITLLTGKNGTMKSSILGLIAHPFSSPNNARDMYGKELKTTYQEVFRLSLEKDSNEYIYYINAITTKNEEISEPVRLYRRKAEDRHRLTVGATNDKGQGNFSLNTSYLNLKRLFPIIETNATKADISISDKDKLWIARSYETIMQRSAYTKSEAISDKKSKNTLAPADSYYDFNSISSGEDNLGNILCKMIAFKNNLLTDNCLQGLFCIDEIEASLHPSAQIQLLDFLLNWSHQFHIQVIVTTHSLYLIDHCLRLQLANESALEEIVINNLSTQQVGEDHNFNIMINPDFNTIYKELTYNESSSPSPYKVNIICEDTVAIHALKSIIKNRNVLQNIEFISDISGDEGSPWKALVSLTKNGKKLLSDSIIILDPDVPAQNITKLNYEYILKIPEPDNNLLPLERRIVYYLYTLDGSSEIFSQTEKGAIISTFTKHHIYSDNIINKQALNTQPFKEWKAENLKLYGKALTHYIKNNPKTFNPFIKSLLSLINKRRATKALPPLTIPKI